MVRVLCAGTVKQVRWRDIHVGQIVEVRDHEDFPADLLCLCCARSDGVAYIRTTNLDGSSATTILCGLLFITLQCNRTATQTTRITMNTAVIHVPYCTQT